MKNNRFIAFLAGAVALAALLRPFPDQFKFRNGGDAVRTLEWSAMILERGITGFPALMQLYLAKWTGFSTPTRWGWIGACALARAIWPRPGDVYHPLVAISWVSGVLAPVPLALWLRGRIKDEAILLALLLCATGPVLRGLSHFPLPDSVSLLCTLAFFFSLSRWLAFRRTGALVAIAITVCVMLSLRETSGIFLIAGVAWLLLEAKRTQKPSWAAVGAIAVGGIVLTVATIVLCGGFATFWAITREVVHGATQTTGSMPYVSGPYYTYLISFMLVSPVLLMATLAALPALVRDPEMGPELISIGLVTVVSLALFSCFTFTLRYVLFVDVGLRVLAASAIWLLWSRDRRRLAIVLLVALVAEDMALHAVLFGKDQVYDPTVWAIARQLRMIP